MEGTLETVFCLFPNEGPTHQELMLLFGVAAKGGRCTTLRGSKEGLAGGVGYRQGAGVWRVGELGKGCDCNTCRGNHT